jgi:hypothetical protein
MLRWDISNPSVRRRGRFVFSATTWKNRSGAEAMIVQKKLSRERFRELYGCF